MKKLICAFLLIPLFSFALDSKEATEGSASPVGSSVASASTKATEGTEVADANTNTKENTNAIANESAIANTKSEAKATTTLSEAEIPVKLEADKKEAAQGRSWLQVLGGLVVCIGLIFGTILFVRKYSLKNQKNPMHQIKVVTQYHLGPRKSLAVIRVAGESVLVGVTEHHISHIKTLALLDGDLPETDEVPQNFNSTLKKQDPEAEEDFSIQGLQDVVKNKLKSMRNI